MLNIRTNIILKAYFLNISVHFDLVSIGLPRHRFSEVEFLEPKKNMKYPSINNNKPVQAKKDVHVGANVLIISANNKRQRPTNIIRPGEILKFLMRTD
tara:strand:+ start:302 stop:595 length:294 start_codon:yes stop_codon:yes gene_type:complete